jgi:predicted metal-dependent hydrolase
MMTDRALHPLFLRGIEQFNRCQFFQCHETWEQLWREERGASRLFYKGLIQAAVALFHLRNGNCHGAEKLLARALEYVSPYRPNHLGLNVDRFRSDLSQCIMRAIATGEGTGGPAFDPLEIPQIHLQWEPKSARDIR